MKPLPTLSYDLIQEMDKDEGVLDIKPSMSDKEIMWRAGRRELINTLKARAEAPQMDYNVIPSVKEI